MALVSFVIPCYRSALTIGRVVEELGSAMEKLPRYEYEIVLVNDCSPDNTLEVISRLALEDEHITAVDLAKNFGQNAALMCGMSHAKGDVIICLDDDGQTPAEEAGKLIEKLEEGYDVVYASYEHKQHSGFRNFGTRLNNLMNEIMLGKPRELSITSYFAVRRFIVEEMLRYPHCYPYVEGLILRSTRKIATVPVNHRAREEGESGYNLAKLIALWMNGFTSFSVKPLRLASIFGAVTAAAGFIYAIFIVISKFTRTDILEGWSSSMALQLVLGGIILLVLGLIGEYLGRIYMCINASPQYVERSVIKKENQRHAEN